MYNIYLYCFAYKNKLVNRSLYFLTSYTGICFGYISADIELWIVAVYFQLVRCANVTDVLCRQRSHVFQWDGKPTSKWSKVDVKLELPKDTILEVEFTQELRGEVS